MKFTLAWLKEHLETTAELSEITENLTDLGLEVEGVENLADRLSDFTIGYIETAEKHPDADKLRVCQVATNLGKRQIICGAPNARAGIYVVVAQPGTYVPGIDTVIKVGQIRGVESEGMMCSEREMELSDEHNGIIEIAKAQIGQSFVDFLKTEAPEKLDPVIEIAITPNRPDALGVRGIARDLVARGLGQLKPLAAPVISSDEPSPVSVTIDKEAQKDCPHFMGRWIKNVKNGPSPEWMQARLRAIGLRPISALVDITNYMTFDLNRPLHVFDADQIKGGLTIAHAKGGETLMGLDDKEYTLDAGMVLISDESQALSMAGIMGGASSACSDETANVFLEAAYFDPIRTAMTGRALKISSDARYRFERGIDPQFTAQGLDIATALILEICGGQASAPVEAGEAPHTQRAYAFRPEQVLSLVGMPVEVAEQRQILQDLGFEFEGDQALAPSWRPDILGSADLVEEIVRVKSLTQLQSQALPRKKQGALRPLITHRQKQGLQVRRNLAAMGLNECVTYSFISQKSAALFGGGDDAVMLANPISQEMSHLRPNLYPGLLEAAARNFARGIHDLALFETGQGWSGGEPEDQTQLASAILMGQAIPRNAFEPARPYDVYDAKAILAELLDEQGFAIDKLTMITPNAASYFHPARSCALGLGPKNIVAEFGEFHPQTLRALGLKKTAIGLTLYYENLPLPKSKNTTRSALVISDLQSTSRDFAFVVDEAVPADKLIKAVLSADKKLIDHVDLFDVFEGAKAEAAFGEGKKSLAISVFIAPKSETLTEKDLQAISDKIIQSAQKSTGAVLRSN